VRTPNSASARDWAVGTIQADLETYEGWGASFYTMRCNWRRWLWGLIPLILLGWAAVYVERDRIQADLIARAKAALDATGSPWAKVDAEGRDVVLTGRAVQDNEPPRAGEAVRNVWGVRVVENRATLPPVAEPFQWGARRRGNRIRLTGHVPDRATRQAVLGLTKAAMPGHEVTEKLRIARGLNSPDTWLAGLSFALKQLSQMKNGDARLDNLTLTISGEAEDPAAYKAIIAALKTGLPKGVTLASAKIAPPVVSPFTWTAQFAGGQLVLAGHVAGGDKTRQDLLAAGKAAAPATNTVDRMEFAEGAPQAWADVAVALLKELARLDSGSAELKDATLTVGGIAHDDAQAQAIRSALRGAVPQSFTLVDQIRVREVKAPEPPPALAPPPAPPQAAPQSEPAPSASTITPAQPADNGPKPPAHTGPSSAKTPAQERPPTQEQAAPAQQAPPTPEPKRDTTQRAEAPSTSAPSQPNAAEPKVSPQAAPSPQPSEPASPPSAKAEKQAANEPARPPEPAPDRSPSPRPEIAMPQAPPAQPLSPQAASCQQELNKIAGAGHIHFATDSAKLDSASFETLDRIAAAAKACPGVRIAIEGHTDTEGSSQYNQRLSVRRAQAVVSYLVKAGAVRKQFVAVGFGPTKPAAPNDTEENMAKNRRIEFSIQQ
jgi:OmpA-OmpF porin, OOP family